jgi:hypothetical protein
VYWFIIAANMISAICEENKEEDGFLYVTYSGENTTGKIAFFFFSNFHPLPFHLYDLVYWFIIASAMMSVICEENKEEDGFLYMTYSGENTFGMC